MFLPIIANIAVLTASVGFKGTWLITILMCAAAAYLVAWEYDRLKPLIFATRTERPRAFKLQVLWIPAFFAAGGAVMGTLWWLIGLGNFSNYVFVDIGLIIFGAIFGVMVAAHYRSMPVGRLNL